MVGILQDFDQIVSILGLCLSNESNGSALSSGPPSPPNAVDVVFRVVRASVIYYYYNRRHIDPSSTYGSRDEYLFELVFEVRNCVFSVNIVVVAMCHQHVEATFQDFFKQPVSFFFPIYKYNDITFSLPFG
eukprot:CAMPEP_0201281746 /NCGR_PEP_ID=MMETSP1317-20130820/3951_1 /ASSEMBLY_ACC=CAM_ASM_000770 /TAXON_ID=187299 /ORGANISM="Undescribed Undescribed, Strain Undescribed" /LENGTH=130 /DNA_ID=CAMNT_0047592501 /DNA_START=766 /DNA_END=1158 /DNA_ORIENTATION=+